MNNREFNLSKNAFGYKNREKIIGDVYLEHDVKEFIRRLKEEIKWLPEKQKKELLESLDRIAGDKLVDKEKENEN